MHKTQLTFPHLPLDNLGLQAALAHEVQEHERGLEDLGWLKYAVFSIATEPCFTRKVGGLQRFAGDLPQLQPRPQEVSRCGQLGEVGVGLCRQLTLARQTVLF